MRPRRLPRFAPPTVADAQPTAAPEAKAAVHKELGYRTAGMVGVNVFVACPMKNRKGHIIQVIAPDGTTSDTLIRDAGGSARRTWSRKT